MRRPLTSRGAKLAISAVTLAVLSGCASVSLEQNVNRVNDEASSFTDKKLTLSRTAQERKERADAAQALLAQPLGPREAVQLALVNSPSMQALLAQGWAESADAAQIGRIANPFFSYERMVAGDELEIGRSLSFGLLDLLTLPARQGHLPLPYRAISAALDQRRGRPGHAGPPGLGARGCSPADPSVRPPGVRERRSNGGDRASHAGGRQLQPHQPCARAGLLRRCRDAARDITDCP